MPAGTWHLKVPGDLATACGVPAVAWVMFWTLELRDAADQACQACLRRIRG